MLDKELLKLIGGNKKYIAYVVVLSVVGLLANLAITASICYAVSLAMRAADGTLESYVSFGYPAIIAAIAIVVRYIITRLTGSLREKLSREVKKDLREKTYNKILSLGVKSTDGMNMAGLTQVAMEGVEQLDLYYSAYLPQFFYAMIAPFILFFVCVGIDWRVAVVLIACVPVIPISIVAVSRYAKRCLPNIGVSTPLWAIRSLTACKA